MKKKLAISLMAFLIVFGGGWSVFEAQQDRSRQSMLLIAYNSLNKAEDSLIPVSPKDSRAEKVAVTTDLKSLIDQNYRKNKVYQITFHQTATETKGNLMVFISTDQKTVVGKGFNDEVLDAGTTGQY